jgi:hypothetical protein
MWTPHSLHQSTPSLSMTEQVTLRLNGVVSCGWTRRLERATWQLWLGQIGIPVNVMSIFGKKSWWPST